ncbi:MAG: hypothetical protein AAF297_12345 [Planctomycetota bacterium]
MVSEIGGRQLEQYLITDINPAGVWFDGRYNCRATELCGFIPPFLDFDGVDFRLNVATTVDTGPRQVFQIAGTMGLSVDTFDYGDTILDTNALENPLEIRSLFGGVIADGYITSFRATIVPGPAPLAGLALASCLAFRRRRC